MKKFILFILMLGILVGIFGYYYYQKNIYSKEVLKLEILSQQEVQAFEEVEFLVKYKNNGNITLEEPKLIFQYPENSLIINDNSQRVMKELEDIYPGEEKTISFKARLIGKENEIKQAEASLRYRPKNLKAFYTSQTTFTTKIKSVPLVFEFDLPSKIESGKEIQFFLNYFSNSDWPISGLRIKIEYPLGFEFISSRPSALEKTEWDLPLLNKTEGGRIEIKGKLLGEIREQKIFRATLGLWQEGQFILLKEIAKGTEILKPSLLIFQQINNSSQYVANLGEVLHYEIFFRNIGSQPFENLFLVAKLSGRAIDFDSIKSESGQFNKGDNFIIWDWREIPKLRFLDQGEEGKVEFWVNLKKDLTPGQDKDLSFKTQIIVSQAREEFETKINSKLEIAQEGYFYDEAFGNAGPLPPRVGQTTTYTISWQVKNYYNDVKNVTVRATLPSEVKLTGKIFPPEASLTFDSDSREIVWSIGDLPAGTGVINSAPLVVFQVAFVPEESQAGQTPQIISDAKISGQDNWTGTTLETITSALNTLLPHDPNITEQMGKVQVQ